MPKLIVSFGANKGQPQAGDDENGGNFQIIDVRQHLTRNPFRDRTLRKLRGTDPSVQADIQKTPGFGQSVHEFVDFALSSSAKVIYFGCTGGHHRSVYIAELVAAALGVPVKHRDINR